MSSGFAACELTHLARVPIDVDRARSQHEEYERALGQAGCVVERLDAPPEMPDSVFIEDVAVVFDELAVITRPGALSRRAETVAVAAALARYRRLHAIEAPATLDGGDVLVAGHRVFVGRSARTNQAAIAQLRSVLGPLGYTVCDVEVRGCLHLKSAVTAVDDDLLLVNPKWIDPARLPGFSIIEIDSREPTAANALRVGDRIIYPAACPRTAERLVQRGLAVQSVDVREIAKAEGAVTCCSLVF